MAENYMKKLKAFWAFRWSSIWSKALLLFGFILYINSLAIAQNRNGAVDLASSGEGAWMRINDEDSSKPMGIESSAFTVEMWVKLQSNNSNDMCFFDFRTKDNRLAFVYKNNTSFRVETRGKVGNTHWSPSGISSSTVFLNNWVHVAFVYNGGSLVQIYINGSRKYSKNFTKDGNNITALYPKPNDHSGDGHCYIGATSPDGTKGKFYVSEVRVWKTNLSSSTISKYYDEEVNKSHPNWGSLVRYYHGTKENIVDNKPYIDDVMNKYDARVNHDTHTRVKDLYPPIKPPAFNNNTFDLNFTANDCQTSDIDVDWVSIHGNTYGYETGNDVKYSISRSKGNHGTEIDRGTSSNYRDTDVSPGDKIRYKLRTYWYVNGVKKYSDDAIYSDYGTIKEQYSAPTNLSATTEKCDKSIDISWSATDNPPKWTVQRSNNSSFSSGNHTATSNLGGTNRSFSHGNQALEQNRYYRVKASGTDGNGCTVSGAWSSGVRGYTSTQPKSPTNFTLSEDIANERINLSWSNPSSSLSDSWVLKKSKSDGSDEVTIDLPLGTRSYQDDDIETCESYRYSIASVNECAVEGVYSPIDKTGNVSIDLSNKITKVEASKGYHPNSVRLQWEVDGSLGDIDRFRIFRSDAEKINYQLIKVVDNDLIFDDETALGGKFYNYKVAGEVACENNTIYTNEPVDLGFMIPYGVANGHVEYEGGNAVEGVTINFEQENASSGKSLEFDGGTRSYVDPKKRIIDMGKADFTLEAWIKTTSKGVGLFANADNDNRWESGEKSFYLDGNGKPTYVGHGCNFIRSTISVNDGQWHHVALSYDYLGGPNPSYAIYVDGENVTAGNSNFTPNRNENPFMMLKIGRNNNNESKNHFDGNMDEIRVWDIARSEEEIKADFKRFLSGGEDNLLVYYRANEGVGTNVYDASNENTVFNKNDGVFVGDITFSDEIPETSKIGITGVTDEFGDYTIDYIPYSSGGEIFRVTPSLGQHAFEPSSRSVYVGDGAQTHNGLDFTDISSFLVQGKVTYKNSEVPVEGVQIMIDGVQAVGVDNKPVRSDENGNYAIDVPIGYHYLSVEKDGHVFSEGFFPPKNEFGDIELHEFTEDLTVNFTDSTKVTVAGRIIGGSREGDKEIGFGKSINNIGIADLTLKLQKEGYDLDVTDDALYGIVSLQTDARTGEYQLELIPEQWIVQKAGNNDYFLDPVDLPVVDLRHSVTELIALDSAEVEGAETVTFDVDTFYYHHKLNYVIQERPDLKVLAKNDKEFKGDSIIVFNNQETGLEDTLFITEPNPFPYPIFQMPKTYEANIYLLQVYRNPLHPDGPVVDEVPVEGAEITVTDNIGLVVEDNTGKTDADGKFTYEFKAGLPSLVRNGDESYTKTFEVDAKVGNIGVKWREDDPFRAYVLGAKPLEGTDFVSYGPEVVEMVLRDPPGSNSYAFIEKGSTYTKKETWQMNLDSNTGLDQTWNNGMYIGAGGGLAGPIIESEYQLDSEIGLEIQRGFDYEGKYSEQWTFTERIETSSDPEDVGSDADVYIGKAYNAFITKTKGLKLIPRQYCIDFGLEYMDIPGSDVVIGIIDGFAVDDGSTATYFAYSQKHIVEELLPELFVLRDELFKGDNYTSNLPYGHRYYGLNNDDNSLVQFKLDSIGQNSALDTANISYTFHGAEGETDSVDFVNEQITQWMNAIATNEAEKAEAEVVKNLSIDGSGGRISEEIEEVYESEYNWTSARRMKFKWNAAFGVKMNGKGYTMNNIFDVGLNFGRGEETKINHSVKFGYVIDERDEGDYYSIDIKHTKGISILNRNKFSDYIPSKGNFIEDQLIRAGIAGGVFAPKIIASKLAYKYTSKSNSFIATAGFVVDVAIFMYETGDVIYNAMNTYDKQGNIREDYDITGFRISSPIFSVRGGQSKCPYEGEEISSFYFDDNDEGVQLHTATLARENPKLDVEPTIRANVPEDQQAVFELKLQNESESDTDIWYDISIDESTNPDGAIILIDGLTAERSFLVPAWETISKTLTIQKGASGVMEYDSIGIILHSQCQFNPMDSQQDIADTIFVSAHFLPECSDVNLANFEENWIINYEDNNQATVKLDSYDLNHSTLEKIDFQYKPLSGDPITVKAYFLDQNSVAYQEFNGPKDVLDEASESFFWDITDLTDREYQVRARSFCADGSVTTTPWVKGTIDRSTPKPFGKPEPTDGILESSEDLAITFNESILTSLVRDNNITLRGILNGADVNHSTSLSLDGIGDYADIPSISLNNKSFTIEFWMQREVGENGVIFSKGSGEDKLEFAFDGNSVKATLGSDVFDIDPSSAYTATYPEHAWHHWAFVYNTESGQFLAYVDDKKVADETGLSFNSVNIESASIGKSATSTGMNIKAKVHEFRIWEEALTLNQVYSRMDATLSGNEIGLYGYWPFDEGLGTLAEDKSSGRNAIVSSGWSLEPGGVAFEFDGTSQYLTANGTNISIGDETDMTIEFWFKAETPSSDMTFLSTGWGENASDEVSNPLYSMAITANSQGNIVVNTNGNAWNAVTNDYFDDKWHHFALIVDRRANAKAYIDGQLQNQIDASEVGGLAGAEFWIGARGRRAEVNGGLSIEVDQYYAGMLDEVRVWNTLRTSEHMDLYRNVKLSGQEVGLQLYYPFETYNNVQGAIIMNESLTDQLDSDIYENGKSAIANSGETYSEFGPAIKDIRPVQDIPFDFVVSDNKIIITPIVDAYRIEGQILEVSVKDIQDLNGNRMQSPAVWTAYVQQNQVKWQESEVTVSIEVGEEHEFTVGIVNAGGIAYDYNLDNIPNWLYTSDASGVVSPNSVKEVTFKVVDGLNTGFYEQGINLSTVLGFDEKLNVSVRVSEDSPEWEVDPSNYQYTMNVFGQLIIGGVVSTDEGDKVGAFVDDVCRGVANVKFIPELDAYEVFLNIYSNEALNPEDIDLRIWDASKGNVHENVTPDLQFVPNKIIGTALNPIDIIASDDITNIVSLRKGWNWISFNLYNQYLSKVDSIIGTIGEDGDIIKGQDGYDLYTEGIGWMGSLTAGDGLEIEEMYKLQIQKDVELKLIGTPASVREYPINVVTGWNYIGFVPQMKMSVREALATLNPTDGDLIKGHHSFAMYTTTLGWIGNLKTLEPNVGYMLFSTKSGTINYPQNSTLSLARQQTEEDSPVVVNASQYADNMSMIASIENAEDFDLTGEEILVAYVGEEARGSSNAVELNDENIYLLPILGNGEASELKFKLIDPLTGEEYEIIESVDYATDQILGSLEAKYPLNIASRITGIGEVQKSVISPNPFDERIIIKMPTAVNSEIEVHLFSTVGQRVFDGALQTNGRGEAILNLDASAVGLVPEGAYVIVVTHGEVTEEHLLIKK
ncbi:LamG domain-containing protein [Aureibacter tunicatorum]|uniref:Fibronectin type-III domain-containing protein n=1 Tax=Aureibacter tunicatorum TaxID=866807 RepID=A0AAE3XRE5_9BACT|nr:LamG domain-containing protein [Aureibacter tunicatorum]MDR6240540.1 hypothetical protein [Aureibacter tunicatorum]BDD06599.1 hypothetical protein AUTU_40820 [Aureibacter tunicatorum]